jgi:lipoprotein-releasing system permease protein
VYHALLTNRYLTSRVIPLIAVAAVALCTALVIIVVSVMSGFVEMVRGAGKTLMGDVIVSYPIKGIPHYERLIDAFTALPEAAAATPVVDGYGLLKMPYGAVQTVQVWGIADTFGDVTGFDDDLYWRTRPEEYFGILVRAVLADHWARLLASLSADQRKALERVLARSGIASLLDEDEESREERFERLLALDSESLRAIYDLLGPDQQRDLATWDARLAAPQPGEPPVILQEGLALRRFSINRPGIVPGIHVSEGNQRLDDGTYRPAWGGGLWMPAREVALTLVPITSEGAILDPNTLVFPVVNEYRSGVYQIDEQRVMIPLETAQEMLALDEALETDPEQLDENFLPEVIGRSPARATMILVRAAEGVRPDELKERVRDAYRRVQDELLADDSVTAFLPALDAGALIRTWEEQNASFIGPVEKERDLMRILFSIIYFVCAGLVLVIFWAIVYEKTRDIGILRSIGAARIGILWIFVRYGLVVGVIGAVVGLGLAWLVVHNINGIHTALGHEAPMWAWVGALCLAGAALLHTAWRIVRGDMLPVVLSCMLTAALLGAAAALSLHKGFLMWDPKVYYFTVIPNSVDETSAAITMVGAVVFSVLGALIPAARAADVDPVAALRYE